MPCASQARPCVHCANLLRCCPRTGPARDHTLQCNAKRTLSSHFTRHSSHPALHASHLHFTVHTSSHLKSFELSSPHVTSSRLFSSHPILLTRHLSKYFPVLLCTTKLAQSTSQVLLCTTKLAQSTSQFYFVLQSLRKALPSTTLYYRACTKHVPALLWTTKLMQNTFHLVTYHYRSLDAATPPRFTKSSCERQ